MHNRRNPMNVEMREIVVRIDTSKVIRVLTNVHGANDRRSLQAALGDRVALPLDQTGAEDQEVPRNLGQCGAHADLYRADRVLAVAPRARGREDIAELLDLARLARRHLMSRRDIRALHRADDPSPPPDSRQFGLVWCQA
jgi:hypothetical protein